MSKIESITQKVSGHIKKPMTADEIAEYLDSFDYSAELALQHLILLFAKAQSQLKSETWKQAAEITNNKIVQEIIENASERFGVSASAIMSKTRKRCASDARAAAQWACYHRANVKLNLIAKLWKSALSSIAGNRQKVSRHKVLLQIAKEL